jgi:hypothetical protein
LRRQNNLFIPTAVIEDIRCESFGNMKHKNFFLKKMSTDAKPATPKPAETKPAETKPAATKPVAPKPADAKPTTPKTNEQKPKQQKPKQKQQGGKQNQKAAPQKAAAPSPITPPIMNEKLSKLAAQVVFVFIKIYLLIFFVLF